MPFTFVFGAPFSANIQPVKPTNPWSDPKAPPPELNLPMSMGPINLPNLPPMPMPEPIPKRRWRWLVVWMLLMFAGGVSAGPYLTNQAYVLVERVAPMLGMSTPKFAVPEPLPNRHLPVQAGAAIPAPAPAPAPVATAPKASAAEALGEPAPVAAKPVPIAVEKRREPEAKPAMVQEPIPARRAAVAAPARAEVAVAESPSAHSQHAKSAAKSASSASTPTRKSSGSEDPFASDTGNADVPKAAPSGKSKPAPSEPAPKAAAVRSHDPLDNLMADGVTDGKGKKRENKDIDALLKDVQKSKPEPPPKREAPPPAAALSPSEISRVMAGVKNRGNECAKRLGQKGTAELKITVGKDGHVTDVQVSGKVADTPLAACVEKATRAATFPASSGLRFDYRIDCR